MATWSRRRFITAASASAGAAAVLPLRAGEPATAPPADLHDWGAVRAQFNLSADYVHASLFFIASHPRPVQRAIEELRTRMDANPFLAIEHGAFGSPDENLHLRACAAVARYIGGRADEIALTSNTTSGLAVTYLGLPLKPGDEILTTEHDHYVHHEAIRFATERSGATWRKIALFPAHDASGASIDSIVAKLRGAMSPATRVLGITWVHSSSGVKLPLREIAAAVAAVNATRSATDKVVLVVDGVHGLGAEAPEVAKSGIDVFVAGLHKWMLGPRGTGFVWAKPEVWATMRPIIPTFAAEEPYNAWAAGKSPAGPARASWMTPGGFESYEHHWAIPAAIGFHEAMGPSRVTARIHELNGAARSALAKMPRIQLRTPLSQEVSAGITAFEIEGMKPEDVVKQLLERRVIASTSPYGITYARVSFGVANSMSDVEKTLAAIRAVVA